MIKKNHFNNIQKVSSSLQGEILENHSPPFSLSLAQCSPHAILMSLRSGGNVHLGPTHRWDSLVYEALIDRDNTAIFFVKGLLIYSQRSFLMLQGLRVYGWVFRRSKFLLRSEVIYISRDCEVRDPFHYPTNGQQFYLIILKAMKSRELKKKNKRLNYFKGDEAMQQCSYQATQI